MRRAARVDQSQKCIVAALRAAGAFVYIIGRPVDLLVRYRGSWSLLEAKSEGTRPRADQIAQREFCALHDVPVVRTPTEALQAIGACRLTGEKRERAVSEYMR